MKNINLDSAIKERVEARSSGKKLKDRITMIGVELEGGWTNIPSGARVTRDGSVRGLRHPSGGVVWEAQNDGRTPASTRVSQRDLDVTNARRLRSGLNPIVADLPPQNIMEVGEIPSPVMPPTELEVWMRKYYPQVVNETCGLHVHMSFESALHYQRLMVPEYQQAILNQMGRWATEEKLPLDHSLWGRLRGDSVYCQHKFWPDHQIRTRGKAFDQRTEGHRYTVINYCYANNGTVECRLLPMMSTADQGIRAVQRILDITNAFLSRDRDKEKKLISTVVAQDDAFTLVNRVTLNEERRSSTMR